MSGTFIGKELESRAKMGYGGGDEMGRESLGMLCVLEGVVWLW